jgi:predicted RNA-binding protein with PIN domain
MPNDCLIIDGNNLVHHAPELARLLRVDFAQARRRLVEKLDELAGSSTYREVQVVFDGAGATDEFEVHSPNLRILFCPPNLTADSVIERLVHSHADPAGILVVTSDRGERDTVEAAGATSISCGNFVDLLDRALRRVASQIKSGQKRKPPGTLGDFFP